MEKNIKKRIMLAVVIAVAIVSVLVGWYFTLRKGIYVGEKFYYKISENRYERNSSDYIERVTDSDFKIVSDGGSRTVTVKADGDLLNFVFPDGTSLTGVWNGTYLMDLDGLPIGWNQVQILANNEAAEISDTTYCQALCRIYYDCGETISEWYINLVGMMIYSLGIVTVLYPHKVHFFLIGWRYNNPKLSDMGRLSEQIGGVVIGVIGILVMTGVWQRLWGMVIY